MSRIVELGIVLGTALAFSQSSSATGHSSVTLGPAVLRIGMTRAAVVAQLAAGYEIQPNGMVVSSSGPPFKFIGSVSFSDDGLLRYVQRDWDPSDQTAGVATAEALYNALTQITDAAPIPRDGQQQSVRVCFSCSVSIIDSSKGALRHIDIFDGSKTISVDIRGASANNEAIPPTVMISESLGDLGDARR
jgi:hypothetical protein